MQTVTQSADLVSTPVDIVQGFKWQAEQKLNRSSGYFFLADIFLGRNRRLTQSQLISNPQLREFLLSACMLSKKSLKHLSIIEQDNLLNTCIDFTKINDPSYERELVNRYFLTSGDALGGVMRNAVGQAAQNLLTNHILQYLQNNGYQVSINKNSTGKITDLTWVENNEKRTIVFDKKPNFLNKSVDFIVTQGKSGNLGSIHNMDEVIACGELKGGVDPAGADEHWKTARSALDRIAEVYTNNNKAIPELYFIGAAIEVSMSQEIFNYLQAGKLTAAANLMKMNQLDEVVSLIVQ
ncbi:hypothetical protein NI462_14155 [Acinetobacter lwoffii]|uniref:AvaI/BsoBI family type II restriction endonuclease n=1 Tax=Acinetobacter lwoffii TaxID=28090 RepID=UPI00209BA4A0|nr:hypothetical protein [Acinetobacter lwoffii]